MKSPTEYIIKMSSPTQEHSALEKAKAEMNAWSQETQTALDSLRTAPIAELEKRLNSLESAIKRTHESAVTSIENASQASNAYIDYLNNRLRTEEQHIIDLKNEHEDCEDLKFKYDHVNEQLKLAMFERVVAQTELEAAKRQPADLQKELADVRQQNHDLQMKSDVAQKRIDELLNDFVLDKQREAFLEAELENAKHRASSMESEFKTFRSGFNQFNEHMDALASSSTEQPTQASPSSALAWKNNQQNKVRDRSGGPQISSCQVRSDASSPQSANSKRDEEPHLLLCKGTLEEIMNEKHRLCNQHFLEIMDPSSSNTPHAHALVKQPVNLTTMKEKLLNRAYSSADSFRADFDTMIANCRKLVPHNNTVRVAGEKLAKIFEEAWAAPRMAHLESQDRTTSNSESRGHKRKASTERPVVLKDIATPRRAPDSSRLRKSITQPGSLAASEGLDSASLKPEQAHPASDWLPETGLDSWRGEITTASHLDINNSFHVTAKIASVTKSPSTFQAPWIELIPVKLCVQAMRIPSGVDDQIRQLDFDQSSDLVILRLTPCSEVEKASFDNLCDDLVSKGRYAKVSHGSDGYIRSLHLIPQSESGRFPSCLSGLDHHLLPTTLISNMLFLVIVFRVGLPEQRLVRMAWDNLIQAVCTGNDVGALVGARSRIRNHSLLVHEQTSRRMSFAEEDMALLRGLPSAQYEPTLGPYSEHFLKLSYSNVDPTRRVLGVVKLPSRVFVLGGMVIRTKLIGLVVVDLQQKERTVWEIRKEADRWDPKWNAMILLRTSFPSSRNKWEATATKEMNYRNGSSRYFGNLGLKIERCGRSD